MPRVPRIMVEISDLELTRYIFFREDNIVVVEGQVVNSYDDLVALCSREPYRDKEYLKMQLLPVVEGG